MALTRVNIDPAKLTLGVKNFNQYPKLLIYGPPKAGKTTSAITGLLNAGLKVLYLNLETNTDGLMEHADNPNLIVMQLTERAGSQYKAINAMLKTSIIPICSAHNMYECPTCDPKNVAGFWGASLRAPKGAVVVIDTVTQILLSIRNAIVAENPQYESFTIDTGKNAKVDTSLYTMFARKLEAIIGELVTQPYPMLFLAHSHNTKNIFESDASDSFVPLLGSGTSSASLNLARNFAAVIAIPHSIKGKDTPVIAKSNASWFASSFNPEQYAGMNAETFVVEYFNRIKERFPEIKNP